MPFCRKLKPAPQISEQKIILLQSLLAMHMYIVAYFAKKKVTSQNEGTVNFYKQNEHMNLYP